MKDIMIFAIPRSGSTLLLNLLREVMNERLFGDETFRVDKHTIIIPLRDFRDCMISYRRVISGKKETEKWSFCEIVKYSFWLKRRLRILERYRCPICFRGNVFYIRYEDYVNNFDYAFDLFEEWFGIYINIEKRQTLKQKYNINNVKKNLTEMKFSEWDDKTNFHGNHISKGAIGMWKTVFTPLQNRFLYYFFRKELLKYGFGIEKNFYKNVK